MPATLLSGGEWRDETAKYAYPFTPDSTLETPDLYFGTDLVLDAALYFKEPIALPVFVGTVSGTAVGSAVLQLCTSANGVVGTCTLTPSAESVEVWSPKGYMVGMLLVKPAAVQRLINTLPGRSLVLPATMAAFSLDVVTVSAAKPLRFVEVSGRAFSGEVQLRAGSGCAFVRDDTGSSSPDTTASFRLDVQGVVAGILGNPVLTLNNVACRTPWIASHPRANIRLQTAANTLTFVHAQDTP